LSSSLRCYLRRHNRDPSKPCAPSSPRSG
jgi:hypothetical protein